ncbi:hypothetical protein [Nocardia sp. NPDC051463]|uniref:hypothetical protein n=1 Tax=Nocardia sp. NPDC051463 TaxID=3154845 RepID=UPI003440DA19
MQISWLRKPSKDAVKVAAGVLVIGVIGWAIVAWLTRPNDAERYLNQIRVPGFTKMEQNADTDVVPWAEAIFVGPPVDDVKKIITGPELQLRVPRSVKQSNSTPQPPRTAILPIEEWVAYGEAPNNCHVSVDKILDNRGTTWTLTDEQTARMKDGSASVFTIHVSCGDG